ncbi:MAG: T9SS type A sorting domain-containing protein [Candidatus Kapaibacteriota bacterium]
MCSISGLLRSCALWSAFLLLSLAAFAQQPCGVSVSLIPAGKDTIQVQGGLVERCIYRVELLNSRTDVFSVRFDVISSGTTIWMASTGGPYTYAVGNSSGAWWFISTASGYPAQSTAYYIGNLYVSGPPTHQFRVTYRNQNEQTVCWTYAVGKCSTSEIQPQGGCLVPYINLSTGFNPATGSVIPVTPTAYDPNWIVIQDPLPNTNEPRPASVITAHPAWHVPLPGSQWIAVYNSYANGTNGVYVFERCFCIEGQTRAVAELQVLADDIVDSILVCGQKMTNRTPSYTNNWFLMPARIYRDTITLTSGTCCIRVFVRNTNNVAFGLDIAGGITALGPAANLLADTCCSEAQCWIVGQKIHDLNCNGKIDQGEPGLGGWTITATAGSNTYTATTGSDGWYAIQVPPGTYTLTEQVQPGFSATTPSGAFYVTIAQGQVLQYDFLNCTAPPPCDTIGKVRLDSACCQFTIPIFPATGSGIPGITSIQWSLSGGTMESITNFTGCTASYPNPYGQTSGTITFSPACTNSPMNLAMEVTPTTASGVVTIYLTINHGSNQVCRDTLQLRCARAPITKCDGLAVAPYIFNNLQQSWRTFTITNLKQPASPIKELKITLTPPPCSPTYVWTGGGLSVDGGARSWGYTTSGTPPYSTITMSCPPASSTSAPQGAAANTTVQFNLGVDYTCNWTGTVTLTVIHCDGDTCTLTADWCAKPNPKQCITIGPPIDISLLGPATSPLRIARIMEVRIDTMMVPGNRELHACNATVVPVSRGWDVVGVSIEDELTQDERESGRYRPWVGGVKLTKADAARWALVELQPCKQDTTPIKGPWTLRATLASREPLPDTPRVAVTFYDANGNPIASDTAKAAMQVTSVPVEIVQPGGGSSGILQIVPNPAAEEVRVEYVLARPGEITVELCDLLGKCQLKAELGWMPSGRNSFGMSTADLPTGSYILRLRTSDGVLTAPLRVMR